MKKAIESIQKQLSEIKDLLTAESQKPMGLIEAAEFLNLKESTLHKLCCKIEGSPPAITFYKPLNGKVYFMKSDLVKFAMRNKTKSQQEIESDADAIIKGAKHGK
jgi:hypothetical protein